MKTHQISTAMHAAFAKALGRQDMINNDKKYCKQVRNVNAHLSFKTAKELKEKGVIE